MPIVEGTSDHNVASTSDASLGMGESSASAASAAELARARRLLWGERVKEDVFRRWAQGFQFSRDEPSALVQCEGGPCAAIAPVQGFLLKILLAETPGHCFQDLTPEKCNSLLVRAVCDVIGQCVSPKYRIVVYNKTKDPEGDGPSENDINPLEGPSERSHEDPPRTDRFHRGLSVQVFDTIADVENFYGRHLRVLTEQYGVLLLLYSMILSKTVQVVEMELAELSDPLIHTIYGYGSQSLINLMLTGRAVAHVWDHDQMAGGLRLSGIDRQANVGFLTVMEHMQYCTVGSFYKNPRHPVWVMASETHLTVLFSLEQRLVSPETAGESAERIFRSFDPEGNNFIPSAALQDVLCAADLVSEPDYVEIVRRKLDSENLGIILLSAFMDEFFDGGERSTPDTFPVVHYNGLPRSNPDGRVVYRKGHAALLECDLRSTSTDPMLTCLQTKWPSIDVTWTDGPPPSLN